MAIQKLIHALHPFGDVLEVGFGPQTHEIQKYHPRTHTIITDDPKAALWADLSVRVIPGIWQSALPELGTFDAIFFGIDPIEGGFLTRFHYSDSELDSFCATVAEKKYLSRFLAELEQYGQISGEQKGKMIQKYGLVHCKPAPLKRSGEMLQFLKVCLASHMRKGSRFSCLLRGEFDDPQFFNEIAVDPFLDVRLDGLVLVIEKQ